MKIFRKKKNHSVAEASKVANLKEQPKHTPNYELSQVEIDLLQMLKESPQTRFDLRMGLKIKDSNVRAYIKSLRQKGFPICSNCTAQGYWLGNYDEVQRTMAEFHSRIQEMLENVEGLTRALNECPFEKGECKYLCEKCTRKCEK